MIFYYNYLITLFITNYQRWYLMVFVNNIGMQAGTHNVASEQREQNGETEQGEEQSERFFDNDVESEIISRKQKSSLIYKILFAILLLFFMLMGAQYHYFKEEQKRQTLHLQQQLDEINQKAALLLETNNAAPELKSLDKAKMQKILAQMMSRPKKKVNKFTHNFKPSKTAYFAYNLYQQPNNPNFLQAQLYYYQTKYNISQHQELPLCIVAPGRNLQSEGRYTRFFSSIAKQNYSNYKLIYIDDASTDGTVLSIKKYLTNPQFQKLVSRTKILQNSQRIYALANRNSGIRNHCQEDDIIVDIDPDDVILGQQAFKFINSVYQDPNVWIFYTNYVFWSSRYDEPSEGISGQISRIILSQNKYRTSDTWLTSATRTFRRKVYMKIDDEDFKDEQGKFYKWASDLYMHYSLVELAGPDHYKYLDEIFYYYYLTRNKFKASEKTIDKWNSYTITPYKPLNNLDEEGRKVEKYQVPQWILKKKRKVEDDILNEKLDEKREGAVDKKYFQLEMHGGP